MAAGLVKDMTLDMSDLDVMISVVNVVACLQPFDA